MILLTGWQQGWGLLIRSIGKLASIKDDPCLCLHFHLKLCLISIPNDRGEATGGGMELRPGGLVFHSVLVVAPPLHFHCPVDTLGLKGEWDTWVGHQPVGWAAHALAALPPTPNFNFYCILTHISLQHPHTRTFACTHLYTHVSLQGLDGGSAVWRRGHFGFCLPRIWPLWFAVGLDKSIVGGALLL